MTTRSRVSHLHGAFEDPEQETKGKEAAKVVDCATQHRASSETKHHDGQDSSGRITLAKLIVVSRLSKVSPIATDHGNWGSSKAEWDVEAHDGQVVYRRQHRPSASPETAYTDCRPGGYPCPCRRSLRYRGFPCKVSVRLDKIHNSQHTCQER